VKRLLAFGVYFAGTLTSLSALVFGLEEMWKQGLGGGLLTGISSAAYAIVMWWITAGIGIRLGVFPVEFFKSLQKSLGLGYEPPIEGATRTPERPHNDRIQP
jgi:hypothetical protein